MAGPGSPDVLRIKDRFEHLINVDETTLADNYFLKWDGPNQKVIAVPITTDLSQAVILAPASSARNVVQPTGPSIIPLVIKAAASQTALLFDVRASNDAGLASISATGLGTFASLSIGTLTGILKATTGAVSVATPQVDYESWLNVPTTSGSFLTSTNAGGGGIRSWVAPSALAAQIDHNQTLNLSVGDFHPQYVFKTPTTTARNTVQPSINSVSPLTLQGVASQSAPLLDFRNSANASVASVSGAGGGTFAAMTIGTLNGMLKGVTGVVSVATPGTDYEGPLGNPSTNGFVLSSTTSGTRSWIDPNAAATGYVLITPPNSLRNVIQPSGDFIPLTLMGTPGSTVDLFQIKQGGVTPTLVVRVDPAGKIFVPNARINTFTGMLKASGGDVAQAVAGTDYEAALGNPAGNGYLLSSTTAGARSWVPSSTFAQFWTRDTTAGQEFVYPATTTDKVSIGTNTSPGTTTQLFVAPTVATRRGITIQGFASQSASYADFQTSAAVVEASVLPGGHVLTRGEHRWAEAAANGNNYVGFKAPTTLAGDQIWTLPTADGTAGQVLSTSGGGAGVLSWVTAVADLTPAVILLPTTSARNTIQPSGAAIVPLTIKGFASQSADYLQLQTSAAVVEANFLPGGHFFTRGELRLGELAANGVNYAGFKAPANLAANLIWTLPSADGTTGQVLTWNAGGVLSWTTVATGSSVWSRDTGTVGQEFLFPATNTDKVSIGASTSPATATQLFVTPTVAARQGILIQGKASQTGDFFQIQDNLGNQLDRFLPDGSLWISGNAQLSVSGPNYVAFRAPATIPTSVVWTLPNADGTANQALVTNGAGVLSWADAGSGSITNAVIIAPATTARNVVQPTTSGVVPLTLKGHASQGTTGLLELRTSANALLAQLRGGQAADTSTVGEIKLFSATGGYLRLISQSAGDTDSIPVIEGVSSGDPNNRSFFMSYAGWLYGPGIGGISSNVHYQHIDIIANSRQVFHYPTWLRSGAGLTFFSPDNSRTVDFVCNAAGTVAVQGSGSGATGLAVRADAWAVNNHVFETQHPGGGLRSWFGNYGNLVIAPNNSNGGAGWDATVPLLIDFEPAATMTANAVEFKRQGTLLWNITPNGDTVMRGELRFQEQIANGNQYVGFKAPADLTNTVIWTLPGADGTAGQVLSTNGSGTLSWGAGGGSVDLSGYFLLAGRASGQIANGGINAGENLTLRSTAHATKGRVLIGTSGYDEVNNRLGIGTNTPSHILHVVNANNSVEGIRIDQTISSTGATAPDFAPFRLVTTYTANDVTSQRDLAHTGIHSDLTYGGASAAKGTVHNFTSTMAIANTGAIADNEFAARMGWMRFDGTAKGRAWYTDDSLHGPINVQPDLLNGQTMLINNPFNGTAASGPIGAFWAVTRPTAGGGSDAAHVNATNYANDVGFGVVGYAGTEATKTLGWRVAFQAGGYGTGWMNSGLTSQIGIGVLLQDLQQKAIQILGNFSGIYWGPDGDPDQVSLDRAANQYLQTNGRLRVVGKAVANTPILHLGSTANAVSNSIQMDSGTNNLQLFVAGGVGNFLPGSQVGDTGVMASNGRFLIGQNGTTNPFITVFGNQVGINIGTGNPQISSSLELGEATRAMRLNRFATTAAVTNPVQGHFGFDVSALGLKFHDGTSWQTVAVGAATNFFTRDSVNGIVYPTTLTDKLAFDTTARVILWKSAANTLKIGQDASGTTSVGNKLQVVGPDSPNTPLARFYTNTVQSNSLELANNLAGTANTLSLFVAGATNAFLSGTAAGDAGILSSTGRFWIGKDGQTENYIRIQNGNVGIGVTSSILGGPTAPLDVRDRVTIARDGAAPDNAYQGGLVITRNAANTAQYVNLIRSTNVAWSIGMLYNTSVLGIGNGSTTDVAWAPNFCLDVNGRALFGRSGTPSAGAIAEFYSDPAVPKAIQLPYWNNQQEQDAIAAQAGMFGYQAAVQTLRYRDATVWRDIAHTGQIVTLHAALTGLGPPADDHPQYFLQAGRFFVQALIGGTQPNADLVISSTSHGTKGLIQMGQFTFDEQNQRLGLWTSAPQYGFDCNTEARFLASFNGIAKLRQGVLGTAVGFDVGDNGSVGINAIPDNVERNITSNGVLMKFSGFSGTTPVFEFPDNSGNAYLSTTKQIFCRIGGVLYGWDVKQVNTVAPPSGTITLNASAASSSQINLTWNDPFSTETDWYVERSTDGTSFTQIASLLVNSTSYNNTGLSPSTQYWYRVRAANTGGFSSYSNIANATTQAAGTAPAGPGNTLTATAVSASQINLAWADNATNETGYLIERSPLNNTAFAQVATVGVNVTTYQDTGLTASTLYFYRVRATNAVGPSAYSNEASATTLASSGSAIGDDFNRTNQTPLGTPTGGASGLSWTVVDMENTGNQNRFQINGNRAYASLDVSPTTNAAGAYLLTQGASGVAKCTMVTQQPQVGGMLLRYDTASRTGYIISSINSDGWRLYYVDFKQATLNAFYVTYMGNFPGSGSGGAPANGDILEAELTSGNSTIRCRANGGTWVSIPNCTNNLTSINHGIHATFQGAGAGFLYDDYLWTPAGGGGGTIGDNFSGTWPTSNNGQTWTVSSGATFSNIGGQAQCTNTTGMRLAYLSGQAADCTVECTIPTISNYGGLLLRYDPSTDSGYLVTNQFGGPQWRLYFVTAITTAPVYSDYRGNFGGGVAPQNGDKLKVVMSGNNFTVYLGPAGGAYGTGTGLTGGSHSANNTMTKHGLHLDRVNGNSSAIRWDDYLSS